MFDTLNEQNILLYSYWSGVTCLLVI
jgi:hypothetical protein